MAISPKSVKLLWTAAAGRCAFPGCGERLCIYGSGNAAPFTIGEMAHICGDKPGSNRHDSSQSEAERDDYTNLLLLCPTHHALIDRRENEAEYPADLLLQIKATHEAGITHRLDASVLEPRRAVARKVLAILEENHASWLQYGPKSELARREPGNERAHAVWVSERLSVIVPNNRCIAEILREREAMFRPDEQAAIAAFLLHVRSYERWVRDEMDYQVVLRFPTEFESMIKEASHAGP
ncbi:HNH endonuclease [Pinirhizobacter soli]|uniref:HNH endonuclease n=1 Tax=Pinirhizobacter soli TaxID=2786953 RepID=UPI00202A7B22|nr:HNH endonuclease [Pinirhizobacter soli]